MQRDQPIPLWLFHSPRGFMFPWRSKGEQSNPRRSERFVTTVTVLASGCRLVSQSFEPGQKLSVRRHVVKIDQKDLIAGAVPGGLEQINHTFESGFAGDLWRDVA